MGHSRLGDLPTSKKWSAVVSTIAAPGGGAETHSALADGVETIAHQALEAAEGGIIAAFDDPGLRYTFYLLTQLVLAGRETDWERRLAATGIHLAKDDSLFDLTAQLQRAIEEHLQTRGGPTDTSEMAQQAAGEAISALTAPNVQTLFGSGRNELLDALRRLSTKTGFARLGQLFFARFMSRFLNFYLSRMTAACVGSDRLHNIGEVARFDEAL
ncbi:MAG: hypothetical protein KJ749_05305, partial [Planctomycetes bacterium]|nr:hypothetical protein [Planctomycetota bacterium]